MHSDRIANLRSALVESLLFMQEHPMIELSLYSNLAKIGQRWSILDIYDSVAWECYFTCLRFANYASFVRHLA